MNCLCRPDAAALLAEDDYRRLWRFFNTLGPATGSPTRLRQRYREVWDAGLDGGLNYYRASPLRPADCRPTTRSTRWSSRRSS